MKFFLIVSLILLTSFQIIHKNSTNPVVVTGHIKFRDTSINIRHMVITVRGDNKKLATAYTTDKGDFEITFTPKNERVFKFFCSAPSIGTKLLASIKKFESDTPEMTFYIPANSKTK